MHEAKSEWQQTMTILIDPHIQNKGFITTRHLLNENRMIKSSHPLFEGGTTEVTLDCLSVTESQVTSVDATLKQALQARLSWKRAYSKFANLYFLGFSWIFFGFRLASYKIIDFGLGT